MASSIYNNSNAPWDNHEITTLLGLPPDVGTTTSVVAAFLPVDAAYTAPVIANQPSVYALDGRCLLLYATDAAAGITNVRVTVTGALDRFGRIIPQFIADLPSPGAASTVALVSRGIYTLPVGSVVTHVDGPVDAASRIGLRCNDVFALPFDIAAAGDIRAKTMDNVTDAGAVSTTYMTWTLAGVPNGTRRFRTSGLSTAA